MLECVYYQYAICIWHQTALVSVTCRCLLKRERRTVKCCYVHFPCVQSVTAHLYLCAVLVCVSMHKFERRGGSLGVTITTPASGYILYLIKQWNVLFDFFLVFADCLQWHASFKKSEFKLLGWCITRPSITKILWNHPLYKGQKIEDRPIVSLKLNIIYCTYTGTSQTGLLRRNRIKTQEWYYIW